MITAKKITATLLTCLALTEAAYANEVQLIAEKPTQITYQIVHQKKDGYQKLGDIKSVEIDQNGMTVPIELKDYELTGVILVSIDGHEVPSSVNRFDQPDQCSLTTDKTHSSGILTVGYSPHKLTCSYRGGIFGN